MTLRETVLSAVQLIASASEQRAYEQDVPLANVPAELTELANDIFLPKNQAYMEAFSLDELRDLAHLYGLIREAAYHPATSVSDLQKRPEWRRAMTLAKHLATQIAAGPTHERRR